MKYKAIIVILFSVLATGLCFSLSLLNLITENQIDMVYINEAVTMIEKNSQTDLHRVYDYSVVMARDADYSEKLNQAAKNRETIIDVMIDGESGKAIFYTNFFKEQKRQRNMFAFVIAIVFGVLFVICICYIIYLHYTLYKPFNTLKRFARDIAGGSLDIPLKMDKNNVFGAFTESFDIMREELKSAKNKENQANISKRELIAGLSHDIKTPVASIKAVSELLLAISEDEKLKSKYIIINEKAEQIDRLITDMFNATLEELGELKVTVKEHYSTELPGLIENCDYENRVTISEVPACMVVADALRLGQVLDNVLANSYKYAKTNIDIGFTMTKSHLEMDIHDFGNGVNEDELSAIFNKFYRGSNVGTEVGSGLGLYISKYLMEKQDGDIFGFNCDDGFTMKILIKLA